MRTLYLQQMPSIVGRQALAGRKLFDEFSTISEESLLSFAIISDDEAQKTHKNVKNDFLSQTQLSRFAPDVIYIEGGLFYRDEETWRIPRPMLEDFVFEGGVALIADIDRNHLYEGKTSYRAAASFLGASARYSVSHLGETDSRFPVYGIDQTNNWDSAQNVICKPEKMIKSGWLAPIYDGIGEILAVQPCALESFGSSIVASGNCDTTGTLHQDRWVDERDCCPFAIARQYGTGYVVTIAAVVSDDGITEHCPDNIRWLTRLASFLLSHAVADKKRRTSRYTSPEKLFLSHRSVNKQTVKDVSRELSRKGIDFWLDEEQLVPSDSLVEEISRGLAEMTKFVLFWSKNCVDAPWVHRELNAAISKLIENKIPIMIVRLDKTDVPDIVRDLLRIEAYELTIEETAAQMAKAVDTIARRTKKPQ